MVGADVAAIQQRLAFLAEASATLASSLDYEATLATVARLAVPTLADWCTIHRLDEDGSIRRIALAHADPAKTELVEAVLRYPPVPISPRSRVAVVLQTGTSQLVPDVPDSYIDEIAQDAEQARLLRSLGYRSMMSVPLLARGKSLGAITFVTGESGRRYTEQDLAVARDLAGRAALAVDNALLYREAQQAIRERDIFLASASHDLKIPLTHIRGMASLLQLQGASLQRERMNEWLADIESSATRMASLIDELLDVAQLRMNRPLELDRKATDLVALARQAVERHQQTAPAHRLELRADVPTLSGVWDAVRLERVLDNLLGNAVKFSPDGGPIRVTVGREGEEPDARAVLSVQDEGLGIPAADLPRIFERFHRGENVGRIAGTGVGLAGSRQIVEQHGGTISVTSEEGRGSTFSVRLPLSKDVEPGKP